LPSCNDSPLPAKLHAGWRAGSDEVRPWMGRTAARPKNGRPLQNLLATTPDGFVAAVRRGGRAFFACPANFF
jgi:hypothetical protein